MRRIFSPIDGEVIGEVADVTEEELHEAVSAAYAAWKDWREIPLFQKGEILMKFSALVEKEKDQLAETLCRDNGKTITQAKTEIHNIKIAVSSFTETAKHLLGTVIPPGLEENYQNHFQTIHYEPRGVVVCIIPFNFPSNMFIQKVVPALLSGNTTVILPPSGNPLTVLSLAKLLKEAGVPEDAARCIVAPGRVKEAAVTDPHTAFITLTGSTGTGKRIAELAAEHLIPYTLELGGNDPFIVMEDADVDLAVRELMVGRIANAGQVCCASKRFLIQRNRVEEFTEKTLSFVRALRLGNPMDPETDMGCLISEKAAETVQNQVEQTISQGAHLLTGGKHQEAFYEPTVLSDVTGEMDIARDMEVFGPVIPIIPFETEEEAVEIANHSVYGLSGCIFTEDYRRMIRMTKALETGTVIVNGASNLRSFEMPFNGWKQSGIGAEGAMSTFREMMRPKVTILKNCK